MVHYFYYRTNSLIFWKGGGKVRRFFLFVTAMILIFTLTTGVNAAPSAPKVSYFATVTGDSRCQVNMTVTMHLDQSAEDLSFPIPDQAGSVAVNGSRVFTSRKENVRQISLRRIIGKSTGDITFTVSYVLPDVIHTSELGTLELQLPMLSGLIYPIDAFEFSVTLPAGVDALPGFVSGYHQAGIEEYLTYQVEGATITGSALASLKDHETLSMKLTVSDTMFPQRLSDTQDWSACGTAMVVCAIAALIYWLLKLRFLPLRRARCTELPHGYTAGDLGNILHLRGMDVSATVLTWARLGYVMLQVERSGRVLIHKRMPMGNERKESEQRLFRALFSRRATVDTGSRHYAQLCLDAVKKPQGLTELVRRSSGNPKVFRMLASGMGLFGGVCVAIVMGNGALLQGLLILLLGTLGGLSGYLIQSWYRALIVRDPGRLILCLCFCLGWLVLAGIAGVFSVGLSMVIGLLIAGVLFSWSGRRTEQGKLLCAQISGLRHYLSSVRPEQVLLLCRQDPDYFFTLAASAIALGQGNAFARRFGKLRLEGCPYLVGVKAGNGTAPEWMALLQKTVRSMNHRADKQAIEQFIQFIQSLLGLILKR